MASEGMQSKLVPVLTVALIGAAFVLGLLWGKVSVYEKGGGGVGGGSKTTQADTAAAPAQEGNTNTWTAGNPLEKFKAYAAEVGLNEGDFATCYEDGKHNAAIDADIALAGKAGASGTPTFLINRYPIVGARPYADFQAVIDAVIAGKIPQLDGAPLQPVADTVWQELLKNPVAEKGNGPVVMVEFTDYQCPFCKRHFEATAGQIEDNYVKTGKIRYMARDLPLSFHANAKPGALAARCAGDQGKYWEMHDKLFQEQ